MNYFCQHCKKSVPVQNEMIHSARCEKALSTSKKCETESTSNYSHNDFVNTNTWYCSVCFTDNDSRIINCRFCGDINKTSRVGTVWNCTVCTFCNETTTDVCVMCRNQRLEINSSSSNFIDLSVENNHTLNNHDTINHQSSESLSNNENIGINIVDNMLYEENYTDGDSAYIDNNNSNSLVNSMLIGAVGGGTLAFMNDENVTQGAVVGAGLGAISNVLANGLSQPRNSSRCSNNNRTFRNDLGNRHRNVISSNNNNQRNDTYINSNNYVDSNIGLNNRTNSNNTDNFNYNYNEHRNQNNSFVNDLNVVRTENRNQHRAQITRANRNRLQFEHHNMNSNFHDHFLNETMGSSSFFSNSNFGRSFIGENATYEELLELFPAPINRVHEDEINSLPTHTYNKKEICHTIQQEKNCEKEVIDTCSVCLEDFKIGETVKSLKCFHTFHDHCINKWLRQASLCPVCKFSCK